MRPFLAASQMALADIGAHSRTENKAIMRQCYSTPPHIEQYQHMIKPKQISNKDRLNQEK